MENKLKVFFDGNCVICNWEITNYKIKDHLNKIEWINISHSSFDAKIYGLDPFKIKDRFHSIIESGEILDGIDSFVAIWETLQIFKILQFLAKHNFSKPFFKLGYFIFTKIRPYLPKTPPCSDNCKI
jgi:predicted DCC family thiol-disulfide oxidoreductase YuxK